MRSKGFIVMNRAVFLDRDGVINKIVYHQELGILDTPFTPSQFELLPGVAKSIQALNRLGLPIILVSNQPGMAKGHYDYKTFQAIEKKMLDTLNKNKAKLDGAFYCLHHPEGRVKKYRKKCNCRKPKPGLLLKAARDFDLDLKISYLIGDGITDIQAGKSVGCITFLVGNHKCDLCRFLNEKKVKPDFIVPSLCQAVKIIKQISIRNWVNVSETCIAARSSKLEARAYGESFERRTSIPASTTKSEHRALLKGVKNANLHRYC